MVLTKRTLKITLLVMILSISGIAYDAMAQNHCLDTGFIPANHGEAGFPRSMPLPGPAPFWSITEVVSTESTGSACRPTVVVDDDHTVHVVWYDFTEGAGIGNPCILYRSKPKGGAWNPAELVSSESDISSAQPHMAISAAGTVHVVWWDTSDYGGSGTDGDIFYKYKPKGGDWSETEVVTLDGTPTNEILSSVIAGLDDRVHVIWVEVVSNNYHFYYKQRNPAGVWSDPEPVFLEDRLNSFGASLALDSLGTLHMAWDIQIDSYGNNKWEILYKSRTAEGIWTDLEIVSTESTSAKGHPSLTVGSDLTLHITWSDHTDLNGCGIDKDIFYKKKPYGEAWTTTEVVSVESDGSSNHSHLMIGPDATLHLTWSEVNYSPPDRNIYYKYRLKGCDWSSPERVSTESDSDIQSSDPSIAIDTDGVVHVAWEDWADYQGSGESPDIFYKQKASPLWADGFVLPIRTGGSIHFFLNTDTENAYRNYILLAGVTGIDPGTSLPGGAAVLPLNWDPLTDLIAQFVNLPPFSGFLGTFDSEGRANASLDIPGPISCGFTGPVFFAFAVADPWNYASNPLVIELVD